MKIYIVEDSPGIRQRLKSFLAELGEVIGEADSEEVAVSEILLMQPDVVILDLGLAVGNGVEVLRRIKYQFPAIRVIVLSNYSAQPYREKCRELGADNFLSKDQEFDLIRNLLIAPMYHI